MSAGAFEHGGFDDGHPQLNESQQVLESFEDRVRRLATDLARIGVTSRQIERLFSRYEIDVIEQQLIWLPYRRARNQASVIVMAICENYEKPARIE